MEQVEAAAVGAASRLSIMIARNSKMVIARTRAIGMAHRHHHLKRHIQGLPSNSIGNLSRLHSRAILHNKPRQPGILTATISLEHPQKASLNRQRRITVHQKTTILGSQARARRRGMVIMQTRMTQISDPMIASGAGLRLRMVRLPLVVREEMEDPSTNDGHSSMSMKRIGKPSSGVVPFIH